jgi:hypothetical protein
MGMLRNLLIFTLLLLLATELTYRIYAAGATAFNPVRFNSMNVLLRTDLVKLSEYPEIYYELKPNMDGWFQASRFTTNSHGLADKEYTLEKPDNTFRVAVIGSSWTMGTGVEQQENYHSLIEAQLNEKYPDRNFEFVNFAVEMYGLRELVGTLKYRVEAWQPDLILAAMTTYTSYQEWRDPPPDQALPSRTNPFFQSYVLRWVDRRYNLGVYDRTTPGRPTLPNDNQDVYLGQVLRAFHELDGIADEMDVPLAIMWLSFGKPGGFESNLIETAEKLDLLYIDAFRSISGTRKMIRARQVGPHNKHPNARSHERIAEKVLNDLTENNLLPGVE